MVSFVYLGLGEFDGVQVFKIGKSSKPRQRRRALGIEFVDYIACIDEAEALTLEHFVQVKIQQAGAIQLPNKNDWFYFDEALFQELRTWFEIGAGDLIKGANVGRLGQAEVETPLSPELRLFDERRQEILTRIKALEEQMREHYDAISDLRKQIVMAELEIEACRLKAQLRAE